MTKRSAKSEYYCVAVKRDYESEWRMLTRHDTLEEAQAELKERRGYTGAFNYDNAELRVMSRTEAREVFGGKWNFAPIGSTSTTPVAAVRARRPRRIGSDD